jgi:uncharacterized protein with PIN domain
MDEADKSLRLLADGMLGRLARWLRLLGYDVAYDNAASDNELARRARAEGRVLLTRDRELAARRGLDTLLLESQMLEEQVREVQHRLGPPPQPALSRCSVCNGELRPVPRAEVSELVPRYVLRTQTKFRRCSNCGRIYWPGTHLGGMRATIDELAPSELEES